MPQTRSPPSSDHPDCRSARADHAPGRRRIAREDRHGWNMEDRQGGNGWWYAGLACLWLVAAAGCSSCGPGGCGPSVCVECSCYCRRLDDLHTAWVARCCADHALGNHGGASADYRAGFTQAYVDIALGKTGAPPPIPPRRYWSVCFRSPWGGRRAEEWYAGYQDGVAAARAWCGGTCDRIPSSGAAYSLGPGRDHAAWSSPGGVSPCGGWSAVPAAGY